MRARFLSVVLLALVLTAFFVFPLVTMKRGF